MMVSHDDQDMGESQITHTVILSHLTGEVLECLRSLPTQKYLIKCKHSKIIGSI